MSERFHPCCSVFRGGGVEGALALEPGGPAQSLALLLALPKQRWAIHGNGSFFVYTAET